jgi:hypothetical protein
MAGGAVEKAGEALEGATSGDAVSGALKKLLRN